MSTMVGFDFEKLEKTCNEHNMTVYEAGELVGRSKTYFMVCKNNKKVNRSVLYMFYELVRHLPKNEEEIATQLSFDFSNLEPHEEKASQEETIDQLTEDRKKVEELGYDTICRLYRLANCLKENGYIGG